MNIMTQLVFVGLIVSIDAVKACTHTYMHTYIHTCSMMAYDFRLMQLRHAYIHKYIHTYIHTHTHMFHDGI
jgi:hypothetical protein